MTYHRKTIERWKADVYIVLAFVAGILVMGVILWTTRQQELLSPLPKRYAVWTEKVEVPVPTMDTNILDIVDGIHVLESSAGANKAGLAGYCEKRGESNEYGYGGMQLMICFRNAKEARGRVSLWVAEKLEMFNGSIPRTLCYYNLGKDVSDCEYYQKYLSL